jgi:hypothetical protein
MKQLITSIGVLLITLSGTAQSDTSKNSFVNNSPKTMLNRVQAVVSTGGGVSFSNSRSASTFTYIAPSLHYQVGPKFKINAGFLHYNVNGSSFITKGPGDNNYPNTNKMYSGNLIQLGGLYELNERLTFSGSMMYQVSPLNANKKIKPSATSLGLDYKINPHATLSFKANIVDNSIYYSPMGPALTPTNSPQRMFSFPSTYFPTHF